MASEPRRVSSARLALASGALTAAGLILAVLAGEGAWRGWLAAAVALASVPVGALGLLMIMRLIPGPWARELAPALEASLLALPPAAAAFIPMLVLLGAIYPWVGEPQPTAFRAAYLSAPGFALRTIAWFALVGGLSAGLLVHRGRTPALASLGLIAYVLAATVIAFDWLMSADPAFYSSAFGLYVLSIQMLLAFALACAWRLRRTDAAPRMAGGVLMCLLLIWAYFAFMQYFISWSTNLPPFVRWYERRGEGPWQAAAWVIALSRLAPSALLLFGPVRRSRVALRAIAAAAIAGCVLEILWLALPAPQDAPVAGLAALAVFVLAGLGLTGLAAVALAWGRGRIVERSS